MDNQERKVRSVAKHAVSQQRRRFTGSSRFVGLSGGGSRRRRGFTSLLDSTVADQLLFIHVLTRRGVAVGVCGSVNTDFVGQGWLSDVGVHLWLPERNQVDTFRKQGGDTVDELGELRNSFNQLNFQDGVWESFNVLWWQLVEWPVDTNVHSSPVVLGSVHTVEVVLSDHGQFSVQRDTDSGVTWQLESGSVGLQVFNLLQGLLTVLSHLGEGLRNSVLTLHEGVDVSFLQWESGLDGLFTSPIFSVGLSLNEDSVGAHPTVPSQSVGLGTFILSQSAVVQVQVLVVVVDGGDGGVLSFEILVWVEHQHWQVLQDDQLQLGDVVWVDPVLGGLTNKVLLPPTSGRITLDWVTPGSDQVVVAGELHHDGVVVVFEERLGVQSDLEHRLQVETSELVVLLDDLLETGVVQSGELGQVVDIGNDIG
ncbi:hypothetical protein WICPIJ_009577 [Wickerhamomyces pijperi]|uniref:Uncharacterized protein n=1 Tax=Wickerhamomyces pijperi TaxID=599730 RepID=A0A9P8TDC2_WICPI|nr:hypothetical protein WICPIJ_009577 [Wickerhamomyces pijperi]